MNNESQQLTHAIRLVLAGALGLTSALAVLPAFAQATTDSGKELETVYVTGSRIARASAETTRPKIQIIFIELLNT